MCDVNDRGTKKWTAMMMPEHEEMLRQMWAVQEYKEKPLLDEQQKEEINARLQSALHNNLSVKVTYYSNGEFHTVNGNPVKMDRRKLLLDDNLALEWDNILDVLVLE